MAREPSRTLLPGLAALRGYGLADLRADVFAGLALTAFLVPVGVGYAQASGLPPVTGLYATAFPLLAYAVLGPSRVMVLGPDSSLSALILAIVAPLAAGDEARAVGLAGALAALVGLVIAAAGVFRLGFVTELLSRPVQLGYLAAVALLVFVGQTPKALGFSVTATSLPGELLELGRGVLGGRVIVASLCLGGGALALSLLLRRVAPRAPAALLAVVAGIVATRALGLDRAGVRILGDLPEGLPSVGISREAWASLPELVGGAVGIALVTIADTTVLSQALASARDEESQADLELVAMGAANVVSGFFGGFPVSASASRTPVAIAAGARTQVTGVVGALAVLALVLAGPGLLHHLPIPVLAGVVMGAATGLVDARAIRFLWRASRAELGLFGVAFVSVATIGVVQGIFLAVVLSLGDFVRRAWRPHDAVLGRVDDLKGYHDVSRHERARRIPGLLLYRFDAPLFFANANRFRERLEEVLERNPGEERWIVLDFEGIGDVDATAVDVLAEVVAEQRAAGRVVAVTRTNRRALEKLERAGLTDPERGFRVFATIRAAVRAFEATL